MAFDAVYTSDLQCAYFVCILQAKAEKEFQSEPEQPIDAEEAERASKEADSRSVYVGNVDYDCTPEELQRHFQVQISARWCSPKGVCHC